MEYYLRYGVAITAICALIGWLIARAGFLDDLLLDPPVGRPSPVID